MACRRRRYAPAAIFAGLLIISAVPADPLPALREALSFLRMAKATAAVEAKSQFCKKAREKLLLTPYDTGGYRAAAVAFIIQAENNIGEFNLKKADEFLNLAIGQVNQAILACRGGSLKRAPAGKKK